MKSSIKSLVKRVVLAGVAAIFVATPSASTFAAGFGVTVAPMSQRVVLIPGDSYEASFKVSNPASQTENAYYKLSVEPFFKGEDGTASFEAKGDSGKIVDWVSFEVPTEGELAPNDVNEIKFKIDVPEDASAGGQYASIIVTMMSKTEKEDEEKGGSSEGNNNGSNQTTIKEIKRIAHLVYAEVAGNTYVKGEISDVTLPSFMFSGNITASSSVKNEGNVHGDAYYKMQVFPLFSSEEIYTNVEDPESHTILPGQTLHNETVWGNTPAIGIFNVVYTVEFEGSTAKVEKMVIKCPIWLLFIVLFVIIALIIWIYLLITRRKKVRE